MVLIVPKCDRVYKSVSTVSCNGHFIPQDPAALRIMLLLKANECVYMSELCDILTVPSGVTLKLWSMTSGVFSDRWIIFT